MHYSWLKQKLTVVVVVIVVVVRNVQGAFKKFCKLITLD